MINKRRYNTSNAFFTFTTMENKTITIESIAPSVRIEQWYRQELQAILKDIRLDLRRSVIEPYKSELAMDGIADWLGHVIDAMVSKWRDKLETLSNDVATLLTKKVKTNYDKRLLSILKRKGFTVGFRNSRYVDEQAQIALGENISLIKSVGDKYLDQVRSAVWRSVKGGYDLESLVKQIKHIDGVNDRRAKLIAKDQVAKINQAFEDARAQELGITEAYWLHSHAGKTWRPSHVAANGTRYEIAKGLFLDGKWTKPGELINCRCRKKLIIELTPQNNIASI